LGAWRFGGWLELFGADDREDEVGDQGQRDEADDGVFHGEWVRVLDFGAGPDEEDHEGEEADGGEEVEEVCHVSC
jgi:hypothetical protein